MSETVFAVLVVLLWKSQTQNFVSVEIRTHENCTEKCIKIAWNTREMPMSRTNVGIYSVHTAIRLIIAESNLSYFIF